MLSHLGENIRAFPVRWLLGLIAFFILFADLDLMVSGWFYTPGVGFAHAQDAFPQFVRKGLPRIMIGGVVVLIAVWAYGRFHLGRTLWGISGRVTAFLVSSLALGPGLITNAVFKAYWGRARPSQIVEFGGDAQFTPAALMVDQCASNCSFFSGHAALGFWVFALALLVPVRYRSSAIVASLAFGLMVGVVRIAQGGHFFSDVVFAGVLTVSLSWWLHRKILGSELEPWQKV
ncbi:MAG: phosphoesterase [Alphaproteobacteria bacterium RIFOXYD12_FULL_60_8]|nr:MAG: phosphoesterase [Alphaproteobacteria bacterium RIFOXYD12_FULL_60_8]